MEMRTEGSWDPKSSDRMIPIMQPTAHQLTALPDGTEFLNLIVNPTMAVMLGRAALMINGGRMTPEVRESIAAHEGDLGVAITIYVLPEGIVPDEAPTDEKAD